MKRVAKTTIKAYNKSMTPIISEVKIMSKTNKTTFLNAITKMQNIMKNELAKSGKTEKEVRKSIGIKRYEK